MSLPLVVTLTILLLPGYRGEESFAPAGGAAVDAPPHEFHVAYGDMAVEGRVAVYRVRLFKDDLEAALAAHAGEPRPTPMAVDPVVDSRFLSYLAERFVVEADGVELRGRIIASGEDDIDHEPVWTYTVRYDAGEDIQGLRIHSTVFHELFRDQKSVLKVVHFPEGKQRSYYMAPGEETVEIEF